MTETEKLVRECFPAVKKALFCTAFPVDHPAAVILGGQPGAGKSFTAAAAVKSFFGNAVFISGDDFRHFQPDYTELQKKYGKDAAAHTAEFAGKMTEAVISFASGKKYNLVIEGTFRTAEVPLKTLMNLKLKGYQTQVLIQTCSAFLSWKSCQERYEKAAASFPLYARWTAKEHHDAVVAHLAANAEEVWKSGWADRFIVWKRFEKQNSVQAYKCVYDSRSREVFSAAVIDRVLGTATVKKNLQVPVSRVFA